MQVVVTNSPTTDYNNQTWAIAREYGNRIFKDLEEGQKTWGSMGLGMQTDSYIFAKNSISSANENNPKPTQPTNRLNTQKQTCRSFNTTPNEGQPCTWEVANPGKCCNQFHACSYCLATFNKSRDHRELDCEAKKKGNSEDQRPFHPKGSGDQ